MLARLAASVVVIGCAMNAARSAMAAPHYTRDGRLIPPSDYREWIFLSSGLGMSYSPDITAMGASMFNNVFVDPGSYTAFLKTGHWPDGTMLVLENRGGGTAAPPLRAGTYQTSDVMGMEVHVRDAGRFLTGWAFYQFAGNGPGAKVPEGSDSQQCHQAHAAVDTTFVQFDPTLLPTAERLHTLSANDGGGKAAGH